MRPETVVAENAAVKKRGELGEEDRTYGDAANPIKGAGPSDQPLDSAMKWQERATVPE